MKVFISADMEGITGLVTWSQCGRNSSEHYDFAHARKMMTHDVNAAIRGARAAGATDVFVRDAHGNSKSLLIEDLEPGTILFSGTGHATPTGMMAGLDKSFSAALLIGYHAMAGTRRAIMEHTLTGGIHRLKLNGVETGEIGLSALAAGSIGVKIAAVSSDAAGCAEAQRVIQDVHTAVTKEPMSRYAGKQYHPSVTAERIEKAVREGLAGIHEIRNPVPQGEYTLELEYNRSEMAANASRYPGLEEVDGYTLRGTFPNFTEAHRAIWTMLDMESGGTSSHN